EAYSGVRRAEPHGHRENAFQRLELAPRHAGVERHDHADVQPLTVKGLREGTDDLPEAARPGEGRALGGDEEDLQPPRPGPSPFMACRITTRRPDSRAAGRGCPSLRCPRASPR